MSVTVIVRAFGGEPVKMEVVDRWNNLVYVARPESIERIEAGSSEPVGVPSEDVFLFDQEAYDSLISGWYLLKERGCDWGRMTPYN